MNSEIEIVKLNRDDIEGLFLHQLRQLVIPSPEGRFLLHVPKLNDGFGNILIPNVKHMVIDMEGGRDGTVELKRCESDLQEINTDGKQVIVINKIDRHVAVALQSKLEEIEEECGGRTRDAIMKFLAYASGFEFNPETGKAKLSSSRIGFNPDIYYQNIIIAKKLHYNPKDSHSNLQEQVGMLPAERYVKKPVVTTALFIDSPVEYENQKFKNGAMLQISSLGLNGEHSISLIDPSDIKDCYTLLNGEPLIDKENKIHLPYYKINQQKGVKIMSKIHTLTPADVINLETIHVQNQSSRVYVKPDAKFFNGNDEVSFLNEADQVTQRLDGGDGVMICAFNYRVNNDDYKEKSDKFLKGIEAAHKEANNMPELVNKISALYNDLDIGTPDIYTSTREKMKLEGLDGVNKEVVVKEGKAELIRISAQEGDTIRFKRNSQHRDSYQTYQGEAFIQITDRGSRYEKTRGIQPQFAASAYEIEGGGKLEINNVPNYSIESLEKEGPEGMLAGTGKLLETRVSLTRQL
jgi:uridine kinase